MKIVVRLVICSSIGAVLGGLSGIVAAAIADADQDNQWPDRGVVLGASTGALLAIRSLRRRAS